MAVLNGRKMVRCFIVVSVSLCALLAGASAGASVRLKDIAQISGVRQNQLIGYGLVVGLSGTGDSSATSFTFQSVVSMLQRLGISVSKESMTVKNVAAVMVTAELPPFAKEGAKIDCSVSSLGNASSLEGGTLLMTPLQGPDGKVYAVAQGGVSIGGFNAGSAEGAEGGMTVQKNHPTVGRIPDGALIEQDLAGESLNGQTLRIMLRKADFTTCERVIAAINDDLQGAYAAADDAGTVTVTVPEGLRADPIGFIARIERVSVVPDAPAAIVINERTGTIVAGENVRISTVAVSHGNLSIQIKSRYKVSQPSPFSHTGTTATVAETETTVDEEKARLMVLTEGANIGEVATALNALGVTPRDMISIFQAIKEAGALQAELRIM